MSGHKDGGPAFPQCLVEPVPGGGSYCTVKNGMSLRDWFAGQVLAGMMANPDRVGNHTKYAEWAKTAYYFADAMLIAREEKP